MTLLRILLAPFTLLHAAVLRIRHLLYDTGVIRPVRPAIPTIAIGNLALGGTGKTPMMELVLRILKGTEQTVSYTHLRAHETVLDLVCRLLLEKKKKNNNPYSLRLQVHLHTTIREQRQHTI